MLVLMLMSMLASVAMDFFVLSFALRCAHAYVTELGPDFSMNSYVKCNVSLGE